MRTIGLFALSLCLPVFVHAAALININTADAALLDSLPGIGLSKANAIIDYRTQNGPFLRIEDIQNVSGIGNGVTYENITPLITVGDTASATTDSTTNTASTTPAAIVGTSAASTYTPPPSSILLRAIDDQTVLREVPLSVRTQVTTKSGAIDSAARIIWSFGDGSSGEGSVVEKTYHFAGTYLVTVTATDGDATASDDFIVTVVPSAVRIVSVVGDGIVIANESADRLDLSKWRLTAGSGIFRIPEGTAILPHASVLFPYAIINIPVSDDAVLSYPDGIIAARYTPPAPPAPTVDVEMPLDHAKPSVATTSYQSVQKVESITSQRSDTVAHVEKAVSAPAATTELAAAGAALDPAPVASPQPTKMISGGLLHSPWTFGLLGVITLAGGAFILL